MRPALPTRNNSQMRAMAALTTPKMPPVSRPTEAPTPMDLEAVGESYYHTGLVLCIGWADWSAEDACVGGVDAGTVLRVEEEPPGREDA